jgi:hypothetical protein
MTGVQHNPQRAGYISCICGIKELHVTGECTLEQIEKADCALGRM